MLRKIDRDVKRFKQIVRGVIRKDFRKYMTHGELVGRQGKRLVSIPLPQIEIPRFRFGSKEAGGVGQGDGEAGDPLGGEPGLEPGHHILEVEVGLDELAAILGEELELPRIHPRGRRTVPVEKARYSSIRRVGPESLRHFKRTFREALEEAHAEREQLIAELRYAIANPLEVLGGIGKNLAADKRYKVELVTKDTQYTPDGHVQQYNAIKDQVLMIAQSLGTPTTKAILPQVNEDKILTGAATLASAIPMALLEPRAYPMEVDGYEPRRGEDVAAMMNVVASDYFGTLRIPLRAGREFEDRDDETAPPAAVVNQTFAQRYFGGAAGAIGKRFRIADGDWRAIVGVAAAP